ncbi:MAG: flagellar hook capping FlgD N-terminal domain-containing protein [Planctomycetota bacterium]
MSAAISPNTAGLNNASTDNPVQRDAFAELSTEEFTRIIVAELTNQDPLEPNDTTAILEQISSLRNIESQGSLEDSLRSLVLQNEVTQAAGIIGKSVDGLSEANNQVSGIVESVRIVDGQALLQLDSGDSLPFDRVTLVTNANPTP